jgi:molybdate transport system ATP-binding protein
MIHLDGLHFRVGAFSLVDVSLQIEQGEYFVILGPSGAGKTLLVECLCGLNRIDSGRVQIAGRDVTRLEPRERRVGYLPQDYALFPHQTVAQNVAFGLARRGQSRAVIRGRVAELMDLVNVAHLADRFPHKLSGGERQRVALARALAIQPDALILDEPVSALDENSRDVLCRELKRLQQATGTTTIHVCHNFLEMMTVADRAAILSAGRIVQVGSPSDLLQRPRNPLVARFVQAGNILEARAVPDAASTRLECPGGIVFRSAARAEGSVAFVVRPENIRLFRGRPEPAPGHTVLEGVLSQSVEAGPLVKVVVTCQGPTELAVSLSRRECLDLSASPGDRVFLVVAPEDVHILD